VLLRAAGHNHGGEGLQAGELRRQAGRRHGDNAGTYDRGVPDGRDGAEDLPGMLQITQHADPAQGVRARGRRGGRRVAAQC
jgi:hypothetical protein